MAAATRNAAVLVRAWCQLAFPVIPVTAGLGCRGLGQVTGCHCIGRYGGGVAVIVLVIGFGVGRRCGRACLTLW